MKGIEVLQGKYISDRDDWMTAVPGFAMCILTLAALLADLFVNGMSEKQYMLYPAAYRIVSILCILAGALPLIRRTMDGRLKIHAESASLALFGVCIIVSTAINGFTRDALLGVPVRYVGVTDFIIYLIIFYGCTALCAGRPLKDLIMSLFLVTADLIAIAAMADRFIISIEAFSNKKELSAIFFHGNHYGYFLVMAVLTAAGYVIFRNGRSAVFGAVSMLLNLAVLAVNQSLGCIIAVGLTMLILLIFCAVTKSSYLAKVLGIFAFLVCMAAAAMIVSQSIRDDVRQLLFDMTTLASGGNHGYAGHLRWLLWTETGKMIAERPLTGYGCEGIRTVLYNITGVSNPHNEVLTYAAFFGIPAAVFYAAGVLAVIGRSFARSAASGKLSGDRRDTSLTVDPTPGEKADTTRGGTADITPALAALGYFISSLFGVGMFYTLPFFFIFLGLSAGLCRGESVSD